MDWDSVLTRNVVIGGYIDQHTPTSEWYRAQVKGIRFVDGLVCIETRRRYIRHRNESRWELLPGAVRYSFLASCSGTLEINGPRRITIHVPAAVVGQLLIYPRGVETPFPLLTERHLGCPGSSKR